MARATSNIIRDIVGIVKVTKEFLDPPIMVHLKKKCI